MSDIAQLCNKQALRWTSHILERIFRRGISTDDIKSALTNYFPNSAEWTDDFKQRKKK